MWRRFYIRQESKYLNYCNSCKAGFQAILCSSKFYVVSKRRDNTMKHFCGGVTPFGFKGHLPSARCQGSGCTRATFAVLSCLLWGLRAACHGACTHTLCPQPQEHHQSPSQGRGGYSLPELCCGYACLKSRLLGQLWTYAVCGLSAGWAPWVRIVPSLAAGPISCCLWVDPGSGGLLCPVGDLQ